MMTLHDSAVDPVLVNISRKFGENPCIGLGCGTPTNIKIASLGRQEPQPAGAAKWPTKLRFGKILGTTSVVRSIENPQGVL